MRTKKVKTGRTFQRKWGAVHLRSGRRSLQHCCPPPCSRTCTLPRQSCSSAAGCESATTENVMKKNLFNKKRKKKKQLLWVKPEGFARTLSAIWNRSRGGFISENSHLPSQEGVCTCETTFIFSVVYFYFHFLKYSFFFNDVGQIRGQINGKKISLFFFNNHKNLTLWTFV